LIAESVKYSINFPPARYLVAETSSVSSVFIAQGYLGSNAQNWHPLKMLNKTNQKKNNQNARPNRPAVQETSLISVCFSPLPGKHQSSHWNLETLTRWLMNLYSFDHSRPDRTMTQNVVTTRSIKSKSRELGFQSSRCWSPANILKTKP